MHKLFGGRHHSPPKINKPLPEPLVDPDEGKTPIASTGELVIVPIQGRDLPNRERFGKQDPFILFKLGNVSKRSFTDVRGGQRPRWKDDQINILMYESDAKDATSLYVTCLDEDHQKSDLIGDCVINLAKVLEHGEHDDWFELSYKGREAGELMLQLTYYSHDPKHPTNRMNRAAAITPSPANGSAPARRPIHPTSGPAKVISPSLSSSSTPPAPAAATSAHTDGGPVYRPPVTTEPALSAVPVAGVYPHGGRISPVGQGSYIAQASPQFPPGNAPGQQQYQYATVSGFPGYANPYPRPYPPADPNKRLSLPNQPLQQQHFPSTQVYPPAGYPPNNNLGGGYPPQQFNTINGYPPQQWGFQNSSSNGGNLYPPTINGGYPPRQGYPPINNNLYPPGIPQATSSLSTSLPSTGLYPPVGYPFAASNLYPPANAGGYPPSAQQTQLGPMGMSLSGNSNSMSVPSSSAQSLGTSAPSTTPLQGSWPGAFPSTSSPSLGNNSGLSGHKQSVNHGQSTSTYPTSTVTSTSGYALSSTTAMMGNTAGGYPPNLPPRARSASPPALPPRDAGQPFREPPSYTQTMLSMPGGW
ncbi:hypothetical protein BGZ72_005348 [Mortierella alpina]|nr:hypothetical protein BGZ72_005348 [Mortierella alpina]